MDNVQAAMSMLRFADLVLGVYLIYALFSFARASKKSPFSRPMGILAISVLLIFLAELMQSLGMLSDDLAEMIRLVSLMVFFILFLYSIKQLRQSALAAEHLARRRFR